MVKSEWNACLACNCVLHNRDKFAHAEICSQETPLNSNSINLSILKHCLIVDSIFIGISIVCEDVPENLLSYYQFTLVQMNPATMQMLHLHIGQKVVLDNRHSMIVWPNSKMNSQSLGLSKRALKKFSLIEKIGVTLIACETANVYPKSITISVEGTAKDLLEEGEINSLHEYVRCKLVGADVKIGTTKQINYYGRDADVKIIQIDDEKVDLEEDVDLDMSSLNISSPDPMNSSRIKMLQFRKLYLPKDNGYCNYFYEITKDTKIKFDDEGETNICAEKEENQPIGGLEIEAKSTRDIITRSLLERGTHISCRGTIIHGVHGVVATDVRYRFIFEKLRRYHGHPNECVRYMEFYGESERKLISYFTDAASRAPTLLCVDDIDVLCGRKDKPTRNDVERRITSCFINQMDLLKSKEARVFILGTTSKMDDIEPSALRAGRLDNDLELNIPSASQRLEILKAILQRLDEDVKEETLREAADGTHGFVGSDLHTVCKEASIHAHKRNSAKIECKDLRFSLSSVKPSAMREIAIEIPKVFWSDIGGQDGLKHQLKQAIEWPLKHPQAFKRLGIRPPKGLLMYGPPGCSKTLVAKALACESKLNFIAIKGPELFSKWVGESEKAVREVFRKARRAAPSIVFFDEIDALAGERSSGNSGDVSDRVLAQLLTEMDGVDALNEVTVIAATNRPDRIDKALLRPGRLDRVVYVPLPDLNTRRHIFSIRFNKRTPIDGDSELLAEKLSELTDGYSGAEVVAVCDEASLFALEDDFECKTVAEHCFIRALEIVKPRTTKESIEFYENYYNNSRK